MNIKRVTLLALMVLFLVTCFEDNVFARAGGGRSGGFGGGSSSYGSRGSRTFDSPMRRSPIQDQFQRSQQPSYPLPQQSYSPYGGFMRSFAGGLAGGFLGSLLFRSLGFGGYGGMGGFGGIGIFEILLLAGGVFLIYKLVASKKQSAYPSYAGGYQQPDMGYDSQPVRDTATVPSYSDDLYSGLARIRQHDPSFDEARFKETVTDIFFKVQAAWMNRDIESARALFSPEILDIMRSDVAKMKSEGRINRLENIAMRNVEITEAWQEQVKDYITVEITANVLDYVTDNSGNVLEGSKTEPAKFMEYWTFARPAGTSPWQLSAIQQAD